jgi:hypothetical protein
MTNGTRSSWGVSVMSRPLFTLGKTRYPLYRRMGGHQGRSGQVQKISLLPGFDPRTVQSVASHYTDYATWPTSCIHTYVIKLWKGSLWRTVHEIGIVCFSKKFKYTRIWNHHTASLSMHFSGFQINLLNYLYLNNKRVFCWRIHTWRDMNGASIMEIWFRV